MRVNGAVQTGPVHALSYVRVSGAEHQRHGLSIDFQGKALAQYVAGQPGWLNHAEYSDIMSGARDDRPQYQAMLDEARRLTKAGKRVAVVTVRVDRLGRDMAEAMRCRKELQKLHVEQHASSQGGFMGTLNAGMHAVMAQAEREVIGERVADVRGSLVADGWPVGRVAFGYRSREASAAEVEAGVARKLVTGGAARVFEADPITGPVAVEVFQRIADGATVRSVSRWLASLPAEVRGDRSWPHQSVTKLLASPTYVARPATGAEDVLSRPAGRWAPLVTDALWQAAQARLAEHETHPHSGSTGAYLLTGFLRCERCGSRMVATSNRQGGRRRAYRCINTECNRLASMPVLDQAMRERLVAVLTAASDPARLGVAWKRLSEPTASVDQARVKTLRAEVSKLNARLANAAALLADGVLDRAGYDALRARDAAAIEAAESELARLTASEQAASTRGLPSLSDALALVGGLAGAVALADVEAVREVLRTLVVSVQPVQVGYGRYDLAISWTALGAALASA